MVNHPIFKFFTVILFIPISVVITALSCVLFIVALVRMATEKTEASAAAKKLNIKVSNIDKSNKRILGVELFAGLN